MEHNLQTISVVSIEELKAAIENLRGKKEYTTLDLVDMLYLIEATPYKDKVSDEEKAIVKRELIEQESEMIYKVIDRMHDNPYKLKKFIELGYFYVSNNIFFDYWENIRRRLYKNVVDLYGHDMYTISKVPFFAVWYEIQNMKKVSPEKLKDMIAEKFGDEKVLTSEWYLIDKIDLWYLIHNHPNKNEISQDDMVFITNYYRDNFYDLFAYIITEITDDTNYYQLFRVYYFSLCTGETMTASLYRDILNEDFDANLPEIDAFQQATYRMGMRRF